MQQHPFSTILTQISHRQVFTQIIFTKTKQVIAVRGLVFPQSRPPLFHTIFYPNQARGFGMRNSNGHEIIHMNKFITNAYLMQARKTLISLPMIRTYMVICLLHMYQLSTGIRPLPFFLFSFFTRILSFKH